jgi:hypothetical protein
MHMHWFHPKILKNTITAVGKILLSTPLLKKKKQFIIDCCNDLIFLAPLLCLLHHSKPD